MATYIVIAEDRFGRVTHQITSDPGHALRERIKAGHVTEKKAKEADVYAVRLADAPLGKDWL